MARRNDRASRGSPKFTYRNSSTIAADGELVIDFSENTTYTDANGAIASQKYLPFNRIAIANTSGVDVEVYLNQDRKDVIFVANNSVVSLEDEDIGGVYSVRVKNLSSTTAATANKINITAWLASNTDNSTNSRREPTGIFGGVLQKLRL